MQRAPNFPYWKVAGRLLALFDFTYRWPSHELPIMPICGMPE